MDEDSRQTKRSTERTWIWALAIGVPVLVCAGLAWRAHSTAPSVIAATPPATAAPTANTRPKPVMPPTAVADKSVRDAGSGISSSSGFASWLKVDDLARRFVAAANAVAEGDSPRHNLDFLVPSEQFSTTRRHGRTVISPKSYQRFNSLADIVATVDAQMAAKAYKTAHGVLDAAYAEIGTPGTTLDGRVLEALHELEAAPVHEAPIEVVATGGSFHFADATLESLKPVRKALVRMGPRNVKIIEDKARELVSALQLSPIAAAPGKAHHPG